MEAKLLDALIGLPVRSADGVEGFITDVYAATSIVKIDATAQAKKTNPIAAYSGFGRLYTEITHYQLDNFYSRTPAKITDVELEEAIAKSRTLQQIAILQVVKYAGDNSFYLSLQQSIISRGSLSPKQARAVLKDMLREYRAIKAQDKADALELAKSTGDSSIIEQHHLDYAASPTAAAFSIDYTSVPMVKPTTAAEIATLPTLDTTPSTVVLLPDGIYTVVINDDGDYRTFKVSSDVSWNSIAKPGNKAVYYLTGPDNSRDFTFYALLTGGDRFIPKKALRNARDLSFALTKLLQPDAFLLAGKTYAMRANRCFVCNKPLTTPDSVASGIGPICAANNGIDQAALAALNIAETRKQQQRKAQADIDELFPS